MSKTKRILVTGGAGFLGSHLCERLVSQQHDVICVDNFFTSQKINVVHLLNEPNFEFIRHDITHPLFLEVDEIYNLACPAAPGHYQYNPIKTMKTSVVGAINLLGMAKRCNAKILQASTSEVYGDPDVHPQPESYRGNVNPIGIRACYDEGKRAAETLFMDYHRMNRVNTRIVRIFNTFGPRMHPFDGRVVSNFIRQSLAGQDITIFGEGNQTRSFCYRDDLVEGIIRLMNASDEITFPVNIGNPEEFTIRQLAELAIELTQSSSQLIYKPLPDDDPTRRKPDIALAQKHLNWTPTIELREGLERTIEWFQNIDPEKYRPPTPNF
ncbi:SDR family oxidoreductase [Pirellulaceae bacterium]|jgi:UDP-glucuronate decarboxylase|nr:SDR family oxidoreductase [Pirellulaceae bacterium]